LPTPVCNGGLERKYNSNGGLERKNNSNGGSLIIITWAKQKLKLLIIKKKQIKAINSKEKTN
jgi:hypothetical protein